MVEAPGDRATAGSVRHTLGTYWVLHAVTGVILHKAWWGVPRGSASAGSVGHTAGNLTSYVYCDRRDSTQDVVEAPGDRALAGSAEHTPGNLPGSVRCERTRRCSCVTSCRTLTHSGTGRAGRPAHCSARSQSQRRPQPATATSQSAFCLHC